MAEPLAVVAFIVGTLFTLKSVSAKLAEDVVAVKRVPHELIPFEMRLMSLHDRMQTWQAFWHFVDGTPLQVYSEYWGSEGQQKVFRLLTQIKSDTERLQEAFDLRFKRDLEIYEQSESLIDYPRLNQVTDLSRFASFQRRYKNKTRLYRRIVRGVFRHPVFENQLKAVEDGVKILEQGAEERFRSHTSCHDDEWKDSLRTSRTSNCVALLAGAHKRALTALYKLLLEKGDHAIELYLDH